MTAHTPPLRLTVLWTRGAGCQELASMLSDGEPIRVSGDLEAACVEHRADVVVGRRLASSFDLVSQAVPIDFDPERIGTVAAAVAGGPNSPLAAMVAERLARALGVPGLMACAYRDDESHGEAVSLIERLYQQVPGIEYRLVELTDGGDLTDSLPPDTALVIGAPGGSWLQRTFFGEGARLRQRAPAGAVVVRAQPPRVFQAMVDPVFVGPLRMAGDILRVHPESMLAVVDEARLVGIVHRERLTAAPPETPVGELMEEPIAVLLSDPVEAASLHDGRNGAPVPVVDDDGKLVGSIRPRG